MKSASKTTLIRTTTGKWAIRLEDGSSSPSFRSKAEAIAWFNKQPKGK